MKTSTPLSKFLVIVLTVVFVTLPVTQAFADRHHNQRKSVRQYHKSHNPKPPQNRPQQPSYKPGKPSPGRPGPSYHKPRPPRYKGRYYRNYRAWRLAAGVAAGIAIGTILATPPPSARTVVVRERTYYVHDNVYYEPVLDGGQVVYQVVPHP